MSDQYANTDAQFGMGWLTTRQSNLLELIQKRALRIILGNTYPGYDNALSTCNLTRLSDRRENICLTFMEKTPQNTDQFKEFLPQSPPRKSMRNPQRLTEIKCKTKRMKNSALPYLVHLVNSK